ncbi:MAG: PAS domain S-box protein [Thermodesulfobacteriota bacterium]
MEAQIIGRKPFEDTRRQSEERNGSFLSGIEDGYFEVELAGNLTFCNEAHSRLLGYAQNELIGMNNRQYMDAENARKVYKIFNRVYQTGSPEKGFEWELIRKDGAKIFVETSVSLILDANHRKIGFRGILRDITRQKQINEEINRNTDLQKVINALLQLSMEDLLLDRILEKAIDIILAVPWLVLESKGAILLVEEDPEVLVMKAQRGLNKILQVTCSRVPFGRCICGRAAIKKEIEFADRVDERHDISYKTMIPHGHYCVPILFSNQILGVLNLYVREGHLREPKEEEFLNALSHTLAGIIVRKRIENSLRESEDRYRDLVESSRDLICTHDLKGKIVSVNEEAARVFGYEKGPILKMNIRDFLFPERKSEFNDYLETIRSHGVASGLMLIQTGKGEKRLVEYHNTLRAEGMAEPIVRSMAHDVTEQKLAEREVKKTLEKLRKALGGIIQVISQTVELRDSYTAGHQRRVADLARAIAQEMGLSAEQVDGLRMAGVIHDLGKISVPAEILAKPGRLSDLEFSLIKIHPQAGHDILKEVEFPWPIARMVLEHHERMDGSGYPQSLKGDEILLESRILAVADVVEAIASHRPYRPAHGIEKALEEIEVNRGLLYDPNVVEACLKLFRVTGYRFD